MSAPLAGVSVVIARPERDAERVARALAQVGAQPIVFAALGIEPIDDARVAPAFATMPAPYALVFVSRNAVLHGLPIARARGLAQPETHICAVGEGTAAALREAGVADVRAPSEGFDSEALLVLPELRDVEGRHVVIVKGEGGRDTLERGLSARGASVTTLACYRRVQRNPDAAPIRAAVGRGDRLASIAMSREALEALLAALPEPLAAVAKTAPLFASHPRVARNALKLGFTEVNVCAADDTAIVQALATRFS